MAERITGQEILDGDRFEELVLGVFDRGLLGFPEGGVELKSGRISPYYFNARPGLSFNTRIVDGVPISEQRKIRTNLFTAYGQLMVAQINSSGNDFAHVVGKEQAMTSPAGVAAFIAGLSYLWVRVDEQNKTYGNHQKIEGDFQQGEAVYLGDDVVTNGASKVEGYKLFQDVGLEGIGVGLLFDREEGGIESLEEHGISPTSALMTPSNTAPILLEGKRIGMREIEAIQGYHEELRESGIVVASKL